MSQYRLMDVTPGLAATARSVPDAGRIPSLPTSPESWAPSDTNAIAKTIARSRK